MDRASAMEQLKLRVENNDIILHCLAVEAIMRKLAGYFNEDAELWGIAGLVHDIDLERIQHDMSRHGLMGGNILQDLDFDETIVYAVKAHNLKNQFTRRRKIDKALYCADPMSGFITACVFLLPEKKLAKVSAPFITDRFYDREFARSISREQILSCTDLGLSLEEFAALSLDAMKAISGELGL